MLLFLMICLVDYYFKPSQSIDLNKRIILFCKTTLFRGRMACLLVNILLQISISYSILEQLTLDNFPVECAINFLKRNKIQKEKAKNAQSTNILQKIIYN